MKKILKELLELGLIFILLTSLLWAYNTSAWEGIGGGSLTVARAISATPRIVDVSFDKRFIEPGEWVTVTVRVTNDGPDTAPLQTIHIGLPFDPPIGDIQIVSTDLSDGAKIYPKGSTLYGPYGSVTSKYPVVEGVQKNFTRGATRYLTIRVRFPNTSTVAFDIKTVAATADWKVIGRDPNSGMIDQQGEYVRTYLILSRFVVSMEASATVEVPISIINHNRYPPSGAPAQPPLVVNNFVVTDTGGFGGSITALNLGLSIPPGSTGTLRIRVTTSNHPSGTYTILYRVSGSP